MTSSMGSIGLASGLDLNGLIQKLIQNESQSQNYLINQKEQKLQVKLTGLGQLKSSLSNFQTSVQKLNDLEKFDPRTVSIGDTTLFTATTTSSADVGLYSVEVSNLAQSQKLASKAFTSTSSVVGTGTFQIEYGTTDGILFTPDTEKTPETITIDSTNQTLEGIKDSINEQSSRTRASIVHDGSGYKLLLTSKNTGASNSMKISITTDGDTNLVNNSGLSQLAYDPAGTLGNGKNMSQTQAAEDAVLIVDGLSITKESNTVEDVIEGVTLNLLKESPGNATTLSISLDKSKIKSEIESLINSYNNVYNTGIKELGKYDPENKKNGLLIGDFTLRSIDSQIRTIVSSNITGLTGDIRSLAEIGITSQDNGALAIDETKFQYALDHYFDDIGKIFASSGQASDDDIKYISSSKNTKAGSYLINITQMATQGTLVGSAAANTTITSGINDTISFDIDGISGTITLSSGIYTAASLATAVRNKLNEVSDFIDAEIEVDVTESAGVLTITSQRYGSSSTVEVTGGVGATDLLGATPTATSGIDVAGTINGASATGDGQYLTGAYGDALDLEIQVNGGTTGARGSIDFSKGKATELDELLTNLLDSTSSLSNRLSSLTTQIEDLNDERKKLKERLMMIEQRYMKQFTELDLLLGKIRSDGTNLMSQLDRLPGYSVLNKD